MNKAARDELPFFMSIPLVLLHEQVPVRADSLRPAKFGNSARQMFFVCCQVALPSTLACNEQHLCFLFLSLKGIT